MSRRRKKNPLLMRIVLATIAIHIIALPIAAHFGAFDKLKREFGVARVTLVPLPKQEKEKAQAKEHKAKTRVAKRQGKASVKRSGPARSNPNRQKVVAVNSPNDNGEGHGPTIEQGTKTNAGEVPTQPTNPGAGNKTVGRSETPTSVAPSQPKPSSPVIQPATPKPAETERVKHVPLYVDVAQDYSPQPVIPDDLRSDPLDKNFVAMFTIGPDGIPTEVKMVQSTGSAELDDIALKTAKKWRFKPATSDGAGVESQVKLTIEFSVE